jgi:hypothetical protein
MKSVMDVNRIQIYNASYTWEAKDFGITWVLSYWSSLGLAGDFRFVSRGKYGPNLDIYNGETWFLKWMARFKRL